MMPAGSVNAWKCERCGKVLVAVHLDDGTTPMFLGCRRTDACPGMMVSQGYPPIKGLPDAIAALIGWEWHRLTSTQLKRAKREEPAMYQHAMAGGLALRPLTDPGRAMFAAALEAAKADRKPK